MKNLMKKNAIVYPYNAEFTPLLRYSTLKTEYNIKALISPRSWGLNNKDASSADEGNCINQIVESDVYDFSSVDTIIISDFDNNDDIIYKMNTLIEYALKNYKDVVCLKKLEQNDIERYSQYSNFTYLNNHLEEYSSKDTTLMHIETPIVCICGLTENINKFDVQLCLNMYFKQHGYKVSNITSKSYATLLGYHSIPNEFYINNDLISKKVGEFCAYVKQIEKREKPDIIIIEIPGGIMPLDKYINNNYGYLHNIVFNAIPCDFVCLNVPNISMSNAFINELKLIMKYRFNSPLCALYMSNKSINHNSIILYDHIEWEIDEFSSFNRRLQENKAESDMIYNFQNVDDIERMGNLIKKQLLENYYE